MKGIYANKKLQQHKLYKELLENQQLYYQLSLEKEQKQKSYLNRINLLDTSSGEVFKMDYDFEKKYKTYTKTIEQKIATIEHISKGLGYASAFITFSLPKEYHPFRSISHKGKRLYVDINKEFGFNTIKDSNEAGYKKLNSIYRSFYLTIKRNIFNHGNEPLYFVKVFEQHSSSILHLHCLLFFPLDYMDNIRGTFKRVVQHHNLEQVDFEEIRFKDNVNYPTRYLLKYITKELKDGSDYFIIRANDGFRRHHKIKYITSSQISLNLYLYTRIFFSLDDKIKAEIDKTVATLKIPVYYYIMENTHIIKSVKKIEESSSSTEVSKQGDKNSLFKVIINIERTRKKSTLAYRVKKLIIEYKNETIYRHNKLVKIENIKMEN